jgi:hypothetical protein
MYSKGDNGHLNTRIGPITSLKECFGGINGLFTGVIQGSKCESVNNHRKSDIKPALDENTIAKGIP